jgi:hypothetical protein
METLVMVDIETASSSPDAALLSIGAAQFDPYGKDIEHRFYEVISLQSSVDAGGITSPETIKWWMSQNSEVMQECWNNSNERDSQSVLVDFNSWLSGLTRLVLWANPPSFDITIVETAMRRLNMKPCWYSCRLMDLRTLRNLVWGSDRSEEVWEGDAVLNDKVQHNARSDAIRQCAMAQQCFAKLGIGID